MEMLKCGKCGKEMDYIDIHELDTDVKNGKIWIVEKWECLECENVEKIEITGNITGIDRYRK